MGLLLLLGLVMGWKTRALAFGIGVASAAPLYIVSAIDMALGGDHNLLGIEWMIYAPYAVPAMLGTACGRRFLRSRSSEDPGSR